jgi:lipid-A-disaccharide synthase
MLIAGEASGDQLAAELVAALRAKRPDAKFFGAGGAQMRTAGVDVVYDMGKLAIVGVTDVIKNVFVIRRLQKQLLAEAIARKPDVFIGVDYGGFNLRFGHAIKQYLRDNPFVDWKPKVVQFISPQVWASRPKRADRMAGDYDLLLSIFPFEKDWYAKRVPSLRVEFVGHPMVERFGKAESGKRKAEISETAPRILLLPGSRRSELKQHLPAMLGAVKLIRKEFPKSEAKIVLPNDNSSMLDLIVWECARERRIKLRRGPAPETLQGARQFLNKAFSNFDIQVGNLPTALAEADVAIAKTGTVTMECAFMRVPTVTLYKGSWLNYQIAKRVITVKSFTMANILAGEEVYPEFLQYDLTAENLARATLEILQDEGRRAKMRGQLDKIIASLGEPGATRRAAESILGLL